MDPPNSQNVTMSQASHSRGNSGSHIEIPCRRDDQYEDPITVNNETDVQNHGMILHNTNSNLEEINRSNIDINIDNL